MKIVIVGGGSFGTAIANQLAYNVSNELTILVQNQAVEDDINNNHCNGAYFQNRKLHASVKATTDLSVITGADLLLLTIPTNRIANFANQIPDLLSPATLMVNMAKGIFDNGQTIVEYLKDKLKHNNVVSLKGASFSIEMFDRNATLLTLGFERKEQLELIKEATTGTNIHLDFTSDVRGVELLSALKNIYAILIGNSDAKFNSANTRFLFLTKAIFEIKVILKTLGGREDTLFLSCGLGDISLTSLNDLSRNRTLGLLIGKGFYNESYQSNSVVLEGVKTLTLIDAIVNENLKSRLPLLRSMISFFIKKEETYLNLNFEQLFDNKFKTILTYGTFDLLHFGHLEILRRAKELGDRLIVGLSTDEFNKGKGKICEFSYEKRKEFLETLEYVDLVIPEENWAQKKDDVLNHNVDVFVMGDDWKGKFDELSEYCEVIYFPRTDGISTTALKALLGVTK